ncbi:MAG: hypothetical protein VYA34_16765 [Myxococcota bacterium]|nr:hypothetical protein [Myxococcota bacterium]
MARFVYLGALLSVLCGCFSSSPCEALKERSHLCGQPKSRYVDSSQSLCHQVRRELTPQRFDPFADCVLKTACYESRAVNDCAETALKLTGANSCEKYRVWSAACGLEPTATDDNCSALSQGVASNVFSSWVECVTKPGCLKENDDRFDTCGSTLSAPPTVMALQACSIIVQWSQGCDLPNLGGFKLEAEDIGSCLLQTELFSVESLFEYAKCIQPLQCEELEERLACINEFRLAPKPPTDSNCEELINYLEHCNTNLGFTNKKACNRIFVNFSEESFSEYTNCITSANCEAEAPGECSAKLKLKTESDDM